jgi:lysophospholipase L1-like esterase
MGRPRKLLYSLLAAALLLALVEGGARVALALLGDGPPPIEVGWTEQPASQYKDELRDTLYAPDPHTFFRLQPSLRVDETVNPRIFDLRTNVHGLRGAELEVAKPPGVFRVMCLGDSCTFGSGAGEAGTFPAKLEGKIESMRRGLDAEVLNTGVPGFTSYQGRRYLEEYGWAFEPDVVVVTFGYNDCSGARGGGKRTFSEELVLSDKEFGDSRRPPSPWACVRMAQRLRSTETVAIDLDDPRQKQRVSVEEFRDNLRSIVADCRARDVVPVLVVWPLRSQSGPDVPSDDAFKDELVPLYQAAARELAAAEGVLLLDLVPLVQSRTSNFVDKVHMNEEGYTYVAQQLVLALLPHLPPAD